jgi:hypothetical protein
MAMRVRPVSFQADIFPGTREAANAARLVPAVVAAVAAAAEMATVSSAQTTVVPAVVVAAAEPVATVAAAVAPQAALSLSICGTRMSSSNRQYSKPPVEESVVMVEPAQLADLAEPEDAAETAMTAVAEAVTAATAEPVAREATAVSVLAGHPLAYSSEAIPVRASIATYFSSVQPAEMPSEQKHSHLEDQAMKKPRHFGGVFFAACGKRITITGLRRI